MKTPIFTLTLAAWLTLAGAGTAQAAETKIENEQVDLQEIAEQMDGHVTDGTDETKGDYREFQLDGKVVRLYSSLPVAYVDGEAQSYIVSEAKTGEWLPDSKDTPQLSDTSAVVPAAFVTRVFGWKQTDDAIVYDASEEEKTEEVQTASGTPADSESADEEKPASDTETVNETAAAEAEEESAAEPTVEASGESESVAAAETPAASQSAESAASAETPVPSAPQTEAPAAEEAESAETPVASTPAPQPSTPAVSTASLKSAMAAIHPDIQVWSIGNYNGQPATGISFDISPGTKNELNFDLFDSLYAQVSSKLNSMGAQGEEMWDTQSFSFYIF